MKACWQQGNSYSKLMRKHSLCNGYRCNKWTGGPNFKSCTRLFVFYISLIRLGEVSIELVSFQFRVNNRVNPSRRRKNSEFKSCKLRLKNWSGVTSCFCWGVDKYLYKKVKLATLVATTPRCRGRYSFRWIAPLYPWSSPYSAEC